VALYSPGQAPKTAYRRILLSGEPIPPPYPADNPPRGEILSESRAGEAYQARVRVEGTGYVLFRSSYHPGLKAEVDGVRAEAVMVTPGLTAIPVRAGTHQVEVSYRAGLGKPFLTLLGVLIVGVGGIASRRGHLARAEARIAARWPPSRAGL
jgi:hypothetical protein